MLKTILNLAWKELLQLVRDRLLLMFLIIVPVVQLGMIAEATGAGIRNIRLAVWDQDKSQFSQDLVTALQNSGNFNLTSRASSYGEVQELMAHGKIGAAVIIPPGFSRDLFKPGVGATVPVIVDGTNAIVASNLFGSVEGAIADLSRQFVGASANTALGAINLKIEFAFNPTLNLRWSTLVTQLGFITYQLVLIVAAVGFVRERELGTLEQLAVTPIRRFELLLGKGLLALLIGLVNFTLLYLALAYGFQIPMRGSLLLLFALGVLFIIAEIGVGTLLSIITASQQQVILMVFLLAMLEVTFSGYLVPTENMPWFMQFLASFSPLQHFSAILRAVYIKGSSLTMVWQNVVPLVALTVVTVSTGWYLFSRAEW
ncbi:MAG: ABC transporter permease [Chloroflexi bacterium]|nr:ABC transporter permease [Chloroflexota bacterium]